MKPIATVTISGRPLILKNRKQISVNRRTGKPFVRSNAQVEIRRDGAILSLKRQWSGRPAIDYPIGLRITAYVAGGHIPDLSNLYEAPQDFMQAAGVIADDRLVEHHDGSRRICLCNGPCPRKQIYQTGSKKGQRKDTCGAQKNCPYERVDIEISPAVPDVIDSEYEYLSFCRDIL